MRSNDSRMREVIIWCVLGGLLVAIFVAGAPLAPFHGDESQWLYMSGDFDDYFIRRDVSRLLYSDAPLDPEDQNLRERNHPVAKYIIGLSRTLAGYSRDELNGYWMWGIPWEWQVANGRLPTPQLLTAGRWLPSALAALSVLALMLVLRLDGWLAALLTGLLLATDASYLLHSRHAMAEGSLMTFSILAVALTAYYITQQRRETPPSSRRRAAFVIGIGLLTGLAVGTKMNGAIAALTVAACLFLLRRWHGAPGRAIWTAVVDLAVVTGVAVAVMMLLSPFLWRDPVARFQHIMEDRAMLVADQSRGRDTFDTLGESLVGMGQNLFWSAPAYAEDAIWIDEWVRQEILSYEASPLSGWRRPAWARAMLIAAFAAGLADLALRRAVDDRARTVRRAVLLWLAISTAVNLIILPFGWQRYYLPQWPAVAAVQALGLAAAVRLARRTMRRSRKAELQHAV